MDTTIFKGSIVSLRSSAPSYNPVNKRVCVCVFISNKRLCAVCVYETGVVSPRLNVCLLSASGDVFSSSLPVSPKLLPTLPIFIFFLLFLRQRSVSL